MLQIKGPSVDEKGDSYTHSCNDEMKPNDVTEWQRFSEFSLCWRANILHILHIWTVMCGLCYWGVELIQ